MLEMNYLVFDSEYHAITTDYLNRSLRRKILSLGGQCESGNKSGRVYFSVTVPKERAKYLKPALEDKIADVIAVNYKYDFFKRKVRVNGLSGVEYELLLSALISADLEEDKRFVRSKLNESPYAVDGAFNFLLKPLIEKWQEIVSFVPAYFLPDQLKRFISYIVGEKRPSKVYVMGDKVYDLSYNVLDRSYLTGEGDCRLIREIILSSSGEVELSAPIPKKDEFYLKEFFGEKILFGKGYFG